jgi:hypothetical protein
VTIILNPDPAHWAESFGMGMRASILNALLAQGMGSVELAPPAVVGPT